MVEMIKLGDVATYINGYAFKPEDRGEEGLPIIRIQDLTGNSYDLGFYDGEYPEKIEINDGDVLISWSASLGVYIWNRGKALLNQHIFKVDFDKAEIDKNYFVYAVRRKLNEMASKTHGATMKHIVKKDFDATLIPYPSMNTQAEISNTLDKVSRIISEREEELQKLDELIKARFVEVFDKCSEEVLIGDVISICRGASPRPIQSFITDDPDGVNWIKIGDVSEKSLYITQTAERITKEGAKKSRTVHRGDFILSNSMSFGRPYILGIEGCVHDGWLILSDFRDTFDELYLYYALRSEHVQHQFSEKVNGATVKNLNSDLVKETYIKVPEMKEQETFADFVKQVDKSKVAVQKSLEETQKLFDSLMQEYFG